MVELIVSCSTSLYIHWPFCPYRCDFCPFVALAGHDAFMERYYHALKTELERYIQQRDSTVPINTIFVGGGTPSTMPDHLILDMFGILKKEMPLSDDIEVTIEVNPGTVRIEQFDVWARCGINRLSIGVQSLNDAVLKKLNRHQTAQQVYDLVHSASQSIKNLSIDLILGLPGISPQEWHDTVAQVVTWPIKHISIYFLTIHEQTPLYFNVVQNRVTLPSDDQVVDMFYWTREYLYEHGFEQYELSNFAREGRESKHNSAYWSRVPYKGLGLGACSFNGAIRYQNEKNLMKYMDGLNRGEDITIFTEEITAHQVQLETVMLGLRRKIGVPLVEILKNKSEMQQTKCLTVIEDFKTQGLITITDDIVRLTPSGMVVENQIITALF